MIVIMKLNNNLQSQEKDNYKVQAKNTEILIGKEY